MVCSILEDKNTIGRIVEHLNGEVLNGYYILILTKKESDEFFNSVKFDYTDVNRSKEAIWNDDFHIQIYTKTFDPAWMVGRHIKFIAISEDRLPDFDEITLDFLKSRIRG